MFSQPGSGYDRAITMFSPDGRLFQVEYAIEAVRRGSLVIGAVCSEGVVIVAEKKLLPLQEEIHSGSEKLWKIDDHIMAGTSGLSSDARQLVDLARRSALGHTLTFDEKPDVMDISTELGNQMQYYTQQGGYRPFGVSLLVGGVLKKSGPKLFVVDPSGAIFGYFAVAIGNQSQNATKSIEAKYDKKMSFDALVKIVLETMKESLEAELSADNFDFAFIKTDTMKYHLLNVEEKQEYIKKYI